MLLLYFTLEKKWNLDMLAAFLHGVILAFGLIIPLGIQNVFIFNQGATQPKFIYALPSILTAFILRHPFNCSGCFGCFADCVAICMV